jgi:hypothetical protein
MGKFHLSLAAGAGLLIAFAASAEAGGRTFTSGTTFAPPGLTHLPSAATTNGNFNSTSINTPSGSTSISTPSGWANQTNNPGWSSTLGTVPPGLNNPPGH